jgi:hypothetical protein
MIQFPINYFVGTDTNILLYNIVMDALVYASIPNNLTSDQELAELHNANVLGAGQSIWTNDKQGDLNALNNLLNQTTIKRSVCLNNQTVPVRIPIPAGITPYAQNVKFGFIDKSVTVPENLRQQMISQGYTPNSDNCNKFYHVYCKNALKNYLAASGGIFNAGEWAGFKPDCACYGVSPAWMVNYGSLPGVCWAPQCIPGAGAYPDLGSQHNPNCTINVCNQQIDVSKIEAQQVASTIQATCNQNAATGPANPFTNPVPPQENQPPAPVQSVQPTQPFQAPLPPSTETPTISSSTIAIGIVLFICCLLLLSILAYFIIKKRQPGS